MNKQSNKKKGLVVLLLLMIGVGAGIYFYKRNKKKKEKEECEKAGGKWDDALGKCVMPVKTDIVQKAFDNLTFASGKATINASSNESLNALAEYLVSIPALSISIEGHTDSVGDEDDNLKLSKARSEAVKTYLVGKGVAEGRIKAVGYGETKPIADNKTAEGRKANRRVEFIIS